MFSAALKDPELKIHLEIIFSKTRTALQFYILQSY